MITLCSYLCGNELYQSRKRKLLILRELRSITQDVIICINYLSLDVFDICQSVFDSAYTCNFRAFKDISDGDFPMRWQSACRQTLSSLSDDEISAFSQIGSILGSCDCESQVKKLGYIENFFDKVIKDNEIKLESQRKLYYTVSVCCGLLLFLIAA